ncbi:MAG: class I SAM-dependent methyltransferase [candidate division Zixibacteria bacterium]|nr:class I SAM-dependent methyltransferase [Candidatus Tariuqbacter arcticus]
MQKKMYYRNGVFIDETDGIPYDGADEINTEHPFMLHPLGFPIFIPRHILSDCNEYNNGDPYTVRENINNEFHQRRINSTVRLLKGIVTAESRILDIGCGEGYITAEIAKRLDMKDICGLDCSLSAIEKAKSSFPQIELAVADAYDPPYPDSFFDVIVCNNLWEHVPDPLSLLTNISRISKPDGFLIISTPSRYRFENLIRVFMGKSVKLVTQNHVTEYSVGQVKEQLRYGGYDVLEAKSQSLKYSPGGIKHFIAYRIVKPLLQLYMGLVNSNHSLETTVFFLAKKLKQQMKKMGF